MEYCYEQTTSRGSTYHFKTDTAVQHSCREETGCETRIIWWDEQ